MSTDPVPGVHSLLNPKAILFGIAVFNYVSFWFKAHTTSGGGVIAPWYFPWSNFNEPTLLLVAACLLYAGRKWTYALALGLSGYLLVFLVSLVFTYDLWSGEMLFDIGLRYLDEWQSQYLLSFVIVIVTAFELIRAVRRPLERPI